MKISFSLVLAFAATSLVAQAPVTGLTGRPIDLRSLAEVAEIDPRFQSFNVEMVEVTGGRFWAPYDDRTGARYTLRPPIDLTSKRLAVLASALAPAYVRVSGTWANSTYIPRVGEAPSTAPPAGFNQVLTNRQWRDAVAFARTNNLAIVTSFPVSVGARAASGWWSADQARRLVSLTQHYGGKIAAAEFFNEPNLTQLGRLPEGYAISDFARDFAAFRSFARIEAPGMTILGPGSSGEGGDLKAAELMASTAGAVDAVSYHFYGALSQRCEGSQTSAAEALSQPWLARTERDYAFYAALRDQYAPGKPIWLTETAQAACGGSPWAAKFRDTFRYVDQLARLARHGVKVVAHNTLAASDYALIDDQTLEPRPDYWAALLWRRMMGTIVLDRPDITLPSVSLYAHCLRGDPGGVAILAENLGETPQTLTLNVKIGVYTMTAPSLDSAQVVLNGRVLRMRPDGKLPEIHALPKDGSIVLPARSISFLAVHEVRNPNCRRTPLIGTGHH